MLTCGSLFSGPGLMDYGLHLAGLEHKWFVESIEFRRRLLAMRFPGCEVHDDVRTFDAVRAPRVDVIAGGFPCRGVSTAGQRTGLAHPETALWREFARIVGDSRPRYVVVENVANILTMHRGTVWGTVLGDLAALGYDAWWDCLPAAAFGAPHLRDRVFLVAHAAGERRTADGPGRVARAKPRGSATAAVADDPRNRCSDGSERWPPEGGLLTANGSRPPADACGGGRAEQSAEHRAEPAIAPPDAGGRGAHLEAGAAAHANGSGLRQQAVPEPERSDPPEPGRTGGFPWGKYEPAIRRWETIAGPVPEPFLPRMAHGRPRGVDGPRVAALGDGVLVQAARYIGELLMELDHVAALGVVAPPPEHP